MRRCLPPWQQGGLSGGVAEVVLLGLGGKAFTAQAFLAGALLNAVPGIIVQLVLIPAVMAALQKAGAVKRIRRIRKFAGRLRRKRSLFALCSCIAVHFSHTATGIAGPVFCAIENNKKLASTGIFAFSCKLFVVNGESGRQPLSAAREAQPY